jgi:hypothetical protein
MKTESNEAYRDLRGRTALDDIKQWAFPDSLIDSISELTEKARASAPDWDEDSLNLAESLMCIALVRSEDLRAYWMAMPQVSWRARWTAFAEANHLESDEIDPALLSEEQSLLAALESGRFTDASSHTKKLDELLATALTKSSGEIIRRRNPQDIVFVDRGTPCPVDKQRGDSRRLIWPWPPIRRNGIRPAQRIAVNPVPSSCARVLPTATVQRPSRYW